MFDINLKNMSYCNETWYMTVNLNKIKLHKNIVLIFQLERGFSAPRGACDNPRLRHIIMCITAADQREPV